MRWMIFAAAAAVAGCASGANPDPVLAASAAPQPAVAASAEQPARIGPEIDHHQHLLSPAAAALIGDAQDPPVVLPADLAALLRRREAAWNDAEALALLYADDVIVLEDDAVTGKTAVAERVSERFGRPYTITPIAYAQSSASRRIAAMYTRGEGADRTNVGMTMITLVRNRSGKWQIASETMKFPAPPPYKPLDGEALIAMLDEADIDRAVVMSIAYMFDNPSQAQEPGAAARLRAENDWTAAEVAKYPARLIGFCSVNPLTDQAIAEVERCGQLGLKGLKLHFGNSNVDLKTAAHLERLKQVFATANRLRLPIAAHLWDGANNYGRRDAELVLEQLLPLTPDIVVQVMHMAGGGPGWTDEALEVFANAVEQGDPRTRNVYFDVATVADLQTHEQLQLLARRIRQIGPERILYGSDGAFAGNAPPDKSWGHFRGMVPLTDSEFAVIRDNVVPYLRP